MRKRKLERRGNERERRSENARERLNDRESRRERVKAISPWSC